MQSPLRTTLRKQRSALRDHRQAFTLIELLVVIGIILTLTAVTIASYSYSINADRVRSAARQFQSFLSGARDKAIYANDIRGVRLLLDPSDNHAVNAMQYIGSPQQDTDLQLDPNPPGPPANPTLWLDPIDTSNHTVMLFPHVATVNRWGSLKNRGFLKVGSRIQIPRGNGQWYTVGAIIPDTATAANNPKLVLNQAVTSLTLASPARTFVLELAPGVLGDAQPVLFPRGVVIDLDGSQVPANWRPTTFLGAYGSQLSFGSPSQMDILFTPRGTVVGDCATTPMVHLHFADVTDVTKWHSNSLLSGRISATYNTTTNPLPIVPANNANNSAIPVIAVNKDRILATLVPRTGNVSVYYVNEKILPTTNTTTPIASDPYSFAETGQVANK